MPDDISGFATESLQLMSNPAGPLTGYGVERLSGAQAGLRVEIESARFNAAVLGFVAATRSNMRITLTTLALDLLSRIQKRTPIKTGRLRMSFHALLPGNTDSYTYSDFEGRRFYGVLATKPFAHDDPDLMEAVVGTNVDYAIYIEAGHSRQAPNGMVAVSLMETSGALEAAAEQAIERAWKASVGATLGPINVDMKL
ncbi:MAG TPA: HK97 gp10 family phage protein [Gemmatimonadales bacterium]|nr:HK97 gp10 family phage protein [Gemmatimonadales bacterium]